MKGHSRFRLWRHWILQPFAIRLSGVKIPLYKAGEIYIFFFASYDRILGNGDATPLILNSDTSWGKRSTSSPNRFTSTLAAPGSQARTGCVGPRLDQSGSLGELINLFPSPGMEPRLLGFAACSAATIPTTLSHPPPPKHNSYQFLVFVGRHVSDGQHVR